MTVPLGLIAGAINAAGNIESFMPQLEDEAVVTVQGNSRALKADLFGIAAATAMGLTANHAPFGFNPPGLIKIEYDAAAKWVRFTVRYRIAMMQVKLDGQFGNGVFTKRLPVLAGPHESVIGGKWNFIGKSVPGLPNFEQDMYWTNKTILQQGPGDNPVPPADEVSKGWGDLRGLVYAALTYPGSTTNMVYNLENVNEPGAVKPPPGAL